MAGGKSRRATPKRKTIGRKSRKRRKESSGEGRASEPGRIEYGPILSVPEAARYLRVTVRTIHRIKASGELPHARVRGRVLFRRKDLEQYIEDRMQR